MTIDLGSASSFVKYDSATNILTINAADGDEVNSPYTITFTMVDENPNPLTYTFTLTLTVVGTAKSTTTAAPTTKASQTQAAVIIP